jgi:hypothetical protein
MSKSFRDVFAAELEFGSLLLCYLNTKDAKKVRLFNKESRSIVANYDWSDMETVVTNLPLWKKCFPRTTTLHLHRSPMMATHTEIVRYYEGLKGIKKLKIKIHICDPCRIFNYATDLEELDIKNTYTMLPLFIYFPRTLTLFRCDMMDDSKYNQYIKEILDVPNRNITNITLKLQENSVTMKVIWHYTITDNEKDKDSIHISPFTCRRLEE